MEIEGSNVELAKRIVELEIQCDRLEEEKMELEKGVMEVKGEEEKMKDKYSKLKDKYVEMKEKFDLEKRNRREENGKFGKKYRQLEVQKKNLEINLKTTEGKNTTSCNEAWKREVERLKSSLEERDGRITNLLSKNEILERQNCRLENDFKAKMDVESKKQKLEELKTLELNKKVKVLEKNKDQMVAEVSDLINALGSEKKKVEALEAMVSRSNMEIERKLKEQREQMIMERDEVIQVLRQEVETLEVQKKELQMQNTLLILKKEDDVESTHPARRRKSNASILSPSAADYDVSPNQHNFLPRASHSPATAAKASVAHPSLASRKNLSSFKVHAANDETSQPKWWEKTVGPNMVDIHSTQEFLSASCQAGDRLVIVEFYGTWCASCRDLFAKVLSLGRKTFSTKFQLILEESRL